MKEYLPYIAAIFIGSFVIWIIFAKRSAKAFAFETSLRSLEDGRALQHWLQDTPEGQDVVTEIFRKIRTYWPLEGTPRLYPDNMYPEKPTRAYHWRDSWPYDNKPKLTLGEDPDIAIIHYEGFVVRLYDGDRVRILIEPAINQTQCTKDHLEHVLRYWGGKLPNDSVIYNSLPNDSFEMLFVPGMNKAPLISHLIIHSLLRKIHLTEDDFVEANLTGLLHYKRHKHATIYNDGTGSRIVHNFFMFLENGGTATLYDSTERNYDIVPKEFKGTSLFALQKHNEYLVRLLDDIVRYKTAQQPTASIITESEY